MRKVFSIQAIRQTIKEIKQDFKQKTVPEQDVVPEQESVTEDFHVGYSWDHYLINVPRSFSLKFRGDVYNYHILSRSETIKSYLNFHNHDIIELLKDKYDRLWLHVYKEYVFDDRIEETFDLVKDEQEADKLSEQGTYHYMGEPPFIHATELNDFILHEDPTEEIHGYIESKRKEIIKLNEDSMPEQAVVPKPQITQPKTWSSLVQFFETGNRVYTNSRYEDNLYIPVTKDYFDFVNINNARLDEYCMKQINEAITKKYIPINEASLEDKSSIEVCVCLDTGISADDDGFGAEPDIWLIAKLDLNGNYIQPFQLKYWRYIH